MVVRNNIFRVVVAAGLGISVVEAANACSCPTLPAPTDALTGSRAVFEGAVVEKRAVLAQYDGWYFPAEEVVFRVTRAWKGAAEQEVTLLEEFNNCASRFSGSESYLVYASAHWRQPARLSAIKCSRTKRIARAAADIAALGPPGSPARTRQSFRLLTSCGGDSVYGGSRV